MGGFSIVYSAQDINPCTRELIVQIEHQPPTSYVDKGVATHGLDVDMIKAILTEAGCPFRWHTEPMSNARTLRGIQVGSLDILANTSDLPERRLYAHFSRPYRAEVIGLFARPGASLPIVKSLDEVYEAKLPLIAPLHGWYGTSYDRLRARFLANNLLTTYVEMSVGTKLLFVEPSRADLLLIDADVFEFLMRTQWKQPVIWVTPPINIEAAHLMLSLKSVAHPVRERIDQAIERLTKNGQLRKIEALYRSKETMQILEQHRLALPTPTEK